MWPKPLIIGIYFASKSTWWLIRHEKIDEAKKSLLRLMSLSKKTDFDADKTLAMMVHTKALKEKTSAGASYLNYFQGHDFRRTDIACTVWTIQKFSGFFFIIRCTS